MTADCKALPEDVEATFQAVRGVKRDFDMGRDVDAAAKWQVLIDGTETGDFGVEGSIVHVDSDMLTEASVVTITVFALNADPADDHIGGAEP